mgnify:CR=1 FL=1
METGTQMSGITYTNVKPEPTKTEKESGATMSPKQKMTTPQDAGSNEAKQQKRDTAPNAWKEKPNISENTSVKTNKEKTPPKGSIRFSIGLSEEQKSAKTEILKHPFNFSF